jgi:GNAT superfamily N-acetyltransferase
MEQIDRTTKNLITPRVYLRWLYAHDLDLFSDLDRSEVVQTGYKMQDGRLLSYPVDWEVPTFFLEGAGEHSVAEQIAFCQKHIDKEGRMIGAFDEEKLVGVGLLTPEVRPGVAQLAYLHISSGYRRSGIAARIVHSLIDWACSEGAKKIYVSATPTESAVGFYQSEGFFPVIEPLPQLFELEPEDIHMVKII